MDRWSPASSTCRIEWRPSRLLASCLTVLGLLGAASLLLSAAPAPLAWPLAVLATWHGLRLARREWRRPAGGFEWVGGSTRGHWCRGGVRWPLTGLELQMRGGMAHVSGRDARGRIRRYLWWPDTLPAAARRQLRLAARSGLRDSHSLPPLPA